MLDGALLDEELVDRLSGLNAVSEVQFSPECSTQAKPAVLLLVPAAGVSRDALEDVGVRVRELLERVLPELQSPVRASIEYPFSLDADGRAVDEEESPLIKIRWRRITSGSVSPTRLNGYPIQSGLPEADADADK